jgi:hypothetical protein
MKTILSVLLIVIALFFVGCFSASRNQESPTTRNVEPQSTGNYNSSDKGGSVADNQPAPTGERENTQTARTNTTTSTQPSQQVSQDKTDNNQANNAATERKIIKNAELVFEVAMPDEHQRKISSIAESKGGYVVSSDSSQQGGSETRPPYNLVKIVLRVPSAKFDETVNEIKASGVGTAKQEKITGRDVTEEFIDVEARLRSMKAEEAQILEVLKRANTINEILTVRQQLASIRQQIESLEGRLRYLQNQTSFSTITVTLQQPGTYVVSPTGFFYRLKRAIGDGLNAAAEVVLFLVQAVLALLPLGVIVAIPTFFLVRYFKRRRRNEVLVQKLSEETKQE